MACVCALVHLSELVRRKAVLDASPLAPAIDETLAVLCGPTNERPQTSQLPLPDWLSTSFFSRTFFRLPRVPELGRIGLQVDTGIPWLRCKHVARKQGVVHAAARRVD